MAFGIQEVEVELLLVQLLRQTITDVVVVVRPSFPKTLREFEAIRLRKGR